MNKCMYISNFLEKTGYSVAAENAVKALYYSKVPIAIRNLPLGNSPREPDVIIKKLLEMNASDADVLIIHSLPEYFEYDGRFRKCIGRFDWEARNLIPTCWRKKIQLMDEVWVTSNDVAEMLDVIGVQIPIRVVPHPVNPLRFETNTGGFVGREKLGKESGQNKKLGELRQLKDNGAFIFYSIGEFVTRKNYDDMIKAWYLSFGKTYNVELVIKTSRNGASAQKVYDTCMEVCNHVKFNLKINSRFAKDPIFITDSWTDEQIDELHKVADCFVSTSHGEGWCQPALDACCFGKYVICPRHTAFLDYIDKNDLVESHLTPCYGATDTASDIYNGHNYWYNVNLTEFILKMQSNYLEQQNGPKFIEKYSYQAIGAKMKVYLN